LFALSCLAALVALALACSGSSSSPTSPSITGSSGAGGVAGASTQATVSPATHGAEPGTGHALKASAPVPQSPTNNQKPQVPLTLVASAASASFADVPLQYRFQIFNEAGQLVVDSGLLPGPSFVTTSPLEGDKRHTWRARAEYQGAAGPWSETASFIAPTTAGYIIGNELYDPLINGTTIGTVHGPVTFIPGLGAKLETQEAYISYELQQTLTEGEFSILVTGMPANTEGGKTKLFAMAEGYSDIVTNDRRMTVEKRGDPPGIIAWRFITHDDQIDTEGPAERLFYDFQADHTYFWEATWRNNFFNVLVRDGGVNGATVYNFGKPFDGIPYDPNPHVIYIGAPVGRSGVEGASVDQAIIRQVWVSSRPRPAFANQ
jgi:hypothetical protein